MTIIQFGDWGDSIKSSSFSLYAEEFVAMDISVKDTLTGSRGRHYFENCYIEGALDFIWGNGRSIYQGCIINVTASLLGKGHTAYITAQARDSTVVVLCSNTVQFLEPFLLI
ncbi:hypothetical protein CRYUN_Cryun09bG0172800 [Craigia yunnanensis]